MLLATLLVILVSAWIYLKSRRPRNFPPGPPRLPWIGSLPFIMTRNPGEKPSFMRGLLLQVSWNSSWSGFELGTQALFLSRGTFEKMPRHWDNALIILLANKNMSLGCKATAAQVVIPDEADDTVCILRGKVLVYQNSSPLCYVWLQFYQDVPAYLIVIDAV